MPPLVADGVLAFLLLGVTYALSSEGLWGAALMFFNVLFGAMIAFNFYEPLAALIDKTGLKWGMSDCICLFVLFAVATLILRLATETLAPAMVRFPMPIYHVGRIFFGLAAALVTVSIIALGYECAPVHKKFMPYKQSPPFGLGIDHKWLGFYQYSTGKIFSSKSAEVDPYGGYGATKVFDPKGEWLLIHQDARPYGEPTDGVLGEDAAMPPRKARRVEREPARRRPRACLGPCRRPAGSRPHPNGPTCREGSPRRVV